MKKIVFQYHLRQSDSHPIKWSKISKKFRSNHAMESFCRFCPDFENEDEPMPISDFEVLSLNIEDVGCSPEADELYIEAHPTVLFYVEDSVAWDPDWFTRTVWTSSVALEIPGVNGGMSEPYFLDDWQGYSEIREVLPPDAMLHTRYVKMEMSDVDASAFLSLPRRLRTTKFLRENLELDLDLYQLEDEVISVSVVSPGLDSLKVSNDAIIGFPCPELKIVTGSEGSDSEVTNNVLYSSYYLGIPEDIEVEDCDQLCFSATAQTVNIRKVSSSPQ